MAATHVVKATVMDIPTSSQTLNEIPVQTTSTEAHQGEEVDLSAMDPARVTELEESGAIETIAAKKEREEAQSAPAEHQAEHQAEHRNRHT